MRKVTQRQDDVDRLDQLLGILGHDLAAALRTVDTRSDLTELAGRIASVLPHEDTSAKAVGPVYETADLVNWLDITRQALHKRVQRYEILAMKTGDNHTIYPAWQFKADGTVRPGVADAVKVLAPVMDDWTRTLWFSGKSPALAGQSPAQWLESGGDPDAVISIAKSRARRMAE